MELEEVEHRVRPDIPDARKGANKRDLPSILQLPRVPSLMIESDRRGARAMGEAWSRFRMDKAALFGAAIIVLVVTSALLAPWARPARGGAAPRVHGGVAGGCRRRGYRTGRPTPVSPPW